MSPLPVNGARGEVALRIGDVDLVIAAEMERLSALSTAMGYPSLLEFQRRLAALEVSTVVLAIRHLVILGDADAAVSCLRLADFAECAKAFTLALNHHFDGKSGKASAAKEAAAKAKQASRSETG